MEIIIIKTGYLEENCYLLKADDKCLIVDPGDDSEKIISKIGNLKPLGILITHHHFDHVGALTDIKEKYNVPIYDYNNCTEKEYDIDSFKFKVIFNPGHSKDSISFYFEEANIMFVGDFVFNGTIGRCDLDGGNYKEMMNSIDKLKTYPSNIILYPGHGEKTNLLEEKNNNPYFNKY